MAKSKATQREQSREEKVLYCYLKLIAISLHILNFNRSNIICIPESFNTSI